MQSRLLRYNVFIKHLNQNEHIGNSAMAKHRHRLAMVKTTVISYEIS